MAEELRRRGVFDQAEDFFSKSLDTNPLDYRAYVGLAMSYLQTNRFDQARTLLEKSLPHAPKREIDYKSYSYRLIGHIYACEEDYDQSAAVLRSAIELSPNYIEGHYDFAQYCAQAGEREGCLSSLANAIGGRPLYWYGARMEQNFAPLRGEVDAFLEDIEGEAFRAARNAVATAEVSLDQALEEIQRVRRAQRRALSDDEPLASARDCETAESKLTEARNKLDSGDYLAALDALPLAEEAHRLVGRAATAALSESDRYRRTGATVVKNLFFIGTFCALGGGLFACCGFQAYRFWYEKILTAAAGFLGGVALTLIIFALLGKMTKEALTTELKNW